MTEEQIRQLIAALEAQGGAVGNLRDELQSLSNAQLELARIQSEAAAAAQEKANKAIEQEIEFRRGATAALEVHEAATLRTIETATDRNEIYQAELDLLDLQIERMKLLSKETGANTVEIQKNIAALKERKKELTKQKKDSDELKKSTDSLSKSFGSMLSGTTPDIDSILNPDKIMGSIADFKKLSKSAGGAGAALSKMAFKAAAGAALALAVNILKLARDLGDGEAAFIRATNASDAFARNITLTYREGRKFTATAEDMFAAATSLTRGFTDFTIMSDEAQRMITTNTAALNKMGLSNEAVAGSLQLMTKSFGMTGKQGVKQLANLEKFATNLGVPLEKLGSDALASGGDLAKLGDNGMEAFKGLAKTMKVTGLEMNKILNLTRQFDTFEGAARQAGKLNAALGGNFVNAMDLMMETDPAARFGQIRDAILDTGLSFDEMSYYQRLFYTDALGLGDVSDLAAVLSGDMESVTGETMKSSQELKELRDRARETASFQEKLNAVFAQMIPILTPLIDGFSNLLTFLSDNATMIKILGFSLIGLAGGPLGVAIGALIALADSIEVGTTGMSFLETIFASIGQSLKGLFNSIKPLYSAFGDLFDMIFSAEDSAEMVKALEIGMLMLAKSFGSVIDAATFVISLGQLITTGFIGVITGDFGPAQEALDNLANAFRGIIEPVMMGIDAIFDLGGQIDFLGFTLFKKTYASSFLDGIIKIGSGIFNLASNFLEVINPIKMVVNTFDVLGSMFSTIIGGINSFFTALTQPEAAANLEKIGDTIKGIPTRKNVEFVASMAAAAGTAAIGATTSKVVGTGRVAGGAAASAIGTQNNNQNTTNIQAANSQPQEVTVNLMLDRDKLASQVVKINGESAQGAITGRGSTV